MGKYLDIVRKFEERRRTEQQEPPVAQAQPSPAPVLSPDDEQAFFARHVPQPVLAQKSRTPEEARTALLPLLIMTQQ